MKCCWPTRSELAMIDDIAMKCRTIIIISFAEVDTGAVTNQPYRHEEEETSSKGVSVLDEHECRQGKH